MTIYVTDDAFSVKAKRFNKMFTSILALFFLLKIVPVVVIILRCALPIACYVTIFSARHDVDVEIWFASQ